MTVAPKNRWGHRGPRERCTPAGSNAAAGKVAQVGMARLPVAAASINILSSDIEVGIDSGSAATTLTLIPQQPA